MLKTPTATAFTLSTLALGTLVPGTAALASDDLERYLLGQDEAPADPPPGLLDKTSFSFRLAGGFTAETDLDVGTVSVARIDSVLASRTRIGERGGLAVQVGTEFSFYDFTGAGPFSAGDEMDSGARYDIGAIYSSQVDETWSWFAGGTITAAPGEGAGWDDAMLYGGVAGANYQVSDTLSVGLGVGVSSRLEDDVRVIPIPTLDWQISEAWRLQTVDRAMRIRGVELSYEYSESWTFFVLGGWASREFRLDDDGPSPSGVLRDERIPVFVGAAFTPDPQVEIRGGAGLSAWSEYELLSSTGASVAEFDGDPAFSAWVGATLRF